MNDRLDPELDIEVELEVELEDDDDDDVGFFWPFTPDNTEPRRNENDDA